MDPIVKQAIDEVKGLYRELKGYFDDHKHLGTDQSLKLDTYRIALTDQATIISSALQGNHFYVTLTNNRTLDNPQNARDGQRLVFELIQDSTGSRTITLGSKFAAGPWTITLTTTASKRDFIECIYNATEDKFYIVNFQKGF